MTDVAHLRELADEVLWTPCISSEELALRKQVSLALVQAATQIEMLQGFVEYLAEDDCEYRDNCDDVMLVARRHTRCTPCKARLALSDLASAVKSPGR